MLQGILQEQSKKRKKEKEKAEYMLPFKLPFSNLKIKQKPLNSFH